MSRKGSRTPKRFPRVPAAFMRRLALDRNPLRRWPDRVRTWVTIGAGLLVLVVAPLVARPVMDMAHRAAVANARVQALHRHQVTAVLLRSAAPARLVAEGPSSTLVPARWTGPDGRPHRDQINVTTRIPAGSPLRIWVDDRGEQVTAPLTASQVQGQTVEAGIGAGLATVVVFGVPAWLIRRVLDRRGYAHWELEWAVLAPQWTKRY